MTGGGGSRCAAMFRRVLGLADGSGRMSQAVIAEDWEGYRVETTLTAPEEVLGKLRIGSPASVRDLNHIFVTGVEHVRLSVKMSDTGEMVEEFRAILSSGKADVVKQLDALGAAPGQLLLADQAVHDSIFESTWGRHDKLVDEIVTANFLPALRRMPIARGEDGCRDCAVEVLADVSLGFRKFAYRFSQSDQVVRIVSELPTATLDTNIPFELWQEGPRRGVVDRLMDLASALPMSLRVTGRIREDVPRAPLADRIDELPELGIDLMGSVIRYGQWDADADTLGSARFEEVRETMVDRSGATPGGPGNPPDWRDWDHLHAHYLRRRDVFLTWDGGILDRADELKGKLDIVVMRPEEYLEQHERKSTGAPG